jgi:hypothetical protein
MRHVGWRERAEELDVFAEKPETTPPEAAGAEPAHLDPQPA